MDRPAAPAAPLRAVRGGPAFQVTPTAGVDVLAWSGDKPLDILLATASSSSDAARRDGAKVVLVEMHPTRPWILSCDKDGEVFLFDYHSNQVLMRRTAQDMLRYGGKENVAGVPTAPVPSASPPRPSTIPYTAQHTIANAAAAARGYVPSALSDELFVTAPTSVTSLPDEAAPAATPTPLPTPSTGTVLQIAFADAAAVAHATGTAHPGYASTHHTFNTSGRILVVCEHVVLFYDFEIDSVVSVAASHRKKSPTCAVFACLNTAAMGFADGVIRLWNMYTDSRGRRRKQIKSLATHGTAPIALLKVTHVLRDFIYCLLGPSNVLPHVI